MPEYRITSAEKRAAAGGGYEVTVTVKNIGTGTMPVEVAAVSGERWRAPEKGAAGSSSPATTAAAVQDPSYRSSAATVTLGAGGERTLTLSCPFDPSEVIVDPDVRVLQLNRKLAVAKLKPGSAPA
jgi:hypothetical protein